MVLIPDLWGESSDIPESAVWQTHEGLNPRFVGRVFRLQLVKNFFCFQSFKRCILDSKFFNYQKHCLTKS